MFAPLDRTELLHLPPGQVAYCRFRSLLKFPPPGMDVSSLEHTARRVPGKRPYSEYRDELAGRRKPARELIMAPRLVKHPQTLFYMRRSTDMQQDSLRGQLDLLNRWYEANRERERLPPLFAGEHFVDDAVSRRQPLDQRPAGVQLKRNLWPGYHLAVASLDRLGCGFTDIADQLKWLTQRRVVVHILDLPLRSRFDPDDFLTEFLIGAMATFARLEVQSHSRRRKDVTAAAKRSGVWNGTAVPYGFMQIGWEWKTKSDGTRYRRAVSVPCPAEIECLAECYRSWCSGWSVWEMTEVLKRRGVLRLGKPWNALTLGRAMERMHDEKMRIRA